MNRALAKNYTCPCGHEKTIRWVDALPFCMGYSSSCVGYSECEKCGVTQSHYSGGMEGAIEFQKNMQDINNSNANEH